MRKVARIWNHHGEADALQRDDVVENEKKNGPRPCLYFNIFKPASPILSGAFICSDEITEDRHFHNLSYLMRFSNKFNK